MIAIVKYNAGNIRSVLFALQRIGVEAVVTDDPALLRSAERVIFPGVGEAATAMAYLRERGLDDVLRQLTQPFLGICLGLQLMCAHSEEGDVDCLGIFSQRVCRFDGVEQAHAGERVLLKVPQIGWNDIHGLGSPLFKGISEGGFVYFVHGYYAELGDGTIATTHYGLDYSAALHKNNFFATQFHPEKSGALGEQILRNFLAL